MGQQSVGKSFSLNHLVDTSFAGSAMWTTGTVQLSVVADKTDGFRGCMDVCHTDKRRAHRRT